MQRSIIEKAIVPPSSVANPTIDAGAVSVGSATYTLPAGALFVAPSGSDASGSGANSTNSNNTFRKVTALRCGNRGFAAYRSNDLELDRVRAEHCNSEHFNYAPECGGMKIGATRRVNVHNSIFSNNYAKGL